MNPPADEIEIIKVDWRGRDAAGDEYTDVAASEQKKKRKSLCPKFYSSRLGGSLKIELGRDMLSISS